MSKLTIDAENRDQFPMRELTRTAKFEFTLVIHGIAKHVEDTRQRIERYLQVTMGDNDFSLDCTGYTMDDPDQLTLGLDD